MRAPAVLDDREVDAEARDEGLEVPDLLGHHAGVQSRVEHQEAPRRDAVEGCLHAGGMGVLDRDAGAKGVGAPEDDDPVDVVWSVEIHLGAPKAEAVDGDREALVLPLLGMRAAFAGGPDPRDGRVETGRIRAGSVGLDVTRAGEVPFDRIPQLVEEPEIPSPDPHDDLREAPSRRGRDEDQQEVPPEESAAYPFLSRQPHLHPPLQRSPGHEARLAGGTEDRGGAR